MKLSLRKCTAGAVGVVTAIVLPILLGFGSLGIEVGHWYLAERQMQGAADAAAMSAAAQFIQDQIAVADNTSTTYQTVGQRYAGLNGFTNPPIPVANTCLMSPSGDNCGAVRALDARPFNCTPTISTPTPTIIRKTYCMVVEITQDTFQWLSTQVSMEPNGFGSVKAIPTPTLVARSVVTITMDFPRPLPAGNSCILALANDRNAVQVRGNGNINARCGVLIDGGRNQNARTPNINSSPACSDGTAAPCGGLTLWGSNAKVSINDLTVAASTAGPAGASCPDANRCLVFNTTTPLPTSKIFLNTATPDPYAGRIFTKPAGQVVTTVVPVAANPGAGYTNGTRTFTVVGGSGPAAKFTANVVAGKVTTVGGIVDPGQYATIPTNPVSVTADDGKGSGAKFILTFGNCFPGAQFASLPAPVPGRAYCSIPVTKTLNFPTGIYYIEGGDATCQGLCIATGNINVTSDAAGVTFVLTNVAGGTTYPTMTISGNNTTSLLAPANNINADGSVCSSSCANTTNGMIVFQDRNAPVTTSVTSGGTVAPSGTLSSFSGCGNSTTCRTLSGTLYLPNQTMNISGNGTVQGACFGLVAKYIDDAGTPTFMNGCLPGSTGGGNTSNPPTGNFRLAQ
jgi:putative Flp pilus-assembly TadE/G-like protein